MSIRSALICCLVALTALTVRTAEARHLVPAGKVVGPDASLVRHPVGDPRYVALSQLLYDGYHATIDVVDLSTQTVGHVTLARADLVQPFGEAPEGDLVSYNGQLAGVLLHGAGRYLYIEVDVATGKIGRTAKLAADHLEVVGTDPANRVAWLARTAGRDVVLSRLELATLSLTEPMRITVPARTPHGMEDYNTFVPSPDFTRFAFVEYVEDGLVMKPPARVYVLDAVARTSFFVPAMSTTYGVAFSRDGKYLYLGSSQHGTLARVDLAAKKIDRRVAGLGLLHYLVVSPDNTTLFVLNSTSTYAAFELPSLKPRTALTHDATLAPAIEQMFDGAVPTLDGRYLVVPEPLPPGPITYTIGPGIPPATQELRIGEFVR